MTMTTTIGGALLAAAALTGQAAQDRWDKIAETDVIIVYVDRASPPKTGALRAVTTRTVYKAPLPDGYVTERIRSEEFECAQNRSRLRKVVVLANDGRAPETREYAAGDATWSDTVPDSIGEQKQEVACGTGSGL